MTGGNRSIPLYEFTPFAFVIGHLAHHGRDFWPWEIKGQRSIVDRRLIELHRLPITHMLSVFCRLRALGRRFPSCAFTGAEILNSRVWLWWFCSRGGGRVVFH